MSGENIKRNERSESEENKVLEEFEEIKLPKEVVNANWRDDREEQVKEINEAIGLELYNNEEEYRSNEVISRDAELKIEMFNKTKAAGRKIIGIIPKEELESVLYERAA